MFVNFVSLLSTTNNSRFVCPNQYKIRLKKIATSPPNFTQNIKKNLITYIKSTMVIAHRARPQNRSYCNNLRIRPAHLRSEKWRESIEKHVVCERPRYTWKWMTWNCGCACWGRSIYFLPSMHKSDAQVIAIRPVLRSWSVGNDHTHMNNECEGKRRTSTVEYGEALKYHSR